VNIFFLIVPFTAAKIQKNPKVGAKNSRFLPKVGAKNSRFLPKVGAKT
jgi:hypothetical protein